jgi:hypothetical protein
VREADRKFFGLYRAEAEAKDLIEAIWWPFCPRAGQSLWRRCRTADPERAALPPEIRRPLYIERGATGRRWIDDMR